MKTWKLNIYNQYFEDIKNGFKTFEIRRNTRNFQIDDIIEFTNIQNKQKLQCKIIYIGYTKKIYKDTDLVILGIIWLKKRKTADRK